MYLQWMTSSESLFSSYNLIAWSSSSWHEMVHGSPEVHQNTQMDSYDLNQGGGGRGLPVLQCSFTATLHAYNTLI